MLVQSMFQDTFFKAIFLFFFFLFVASKGGKRSRRTESEREREWRRRRYRGHDEIMKKNTEFGGLWLNVAEEINGASGYTS